ncbi:MAG: hypothetical protein CML66_21100 [Rhodobacteraceae bacterium]|nr:hypothetical protein [Paracoccaceae bacterium]
MKHMPLTAALVAALALGACAAPATGPLPNAGPTAGAQTGTPPARSDDATARSPQQGQPSGAGGRPPQVQVQGQIPAPPPDDRQAANRQTDTYPGQSRSRTASLTPRTKLDDCRPSDTEEDCLISHSASQGGITFSGYARTGITFSRSLGLIRRPGPDDLF